MQDQKSINGKKISGHVNRLRQLAHNLGNIREGNSGSNAPGEDAILSQIKEVTASIKMLVNNDPIFANDIYFAELAKNYESMVSSVQNAYAVDEALLRDEIVFQLHLGSTSGFKHWLSMAPREFRITIEALLKNQTNKK